MLTSYENATKEFRSILDFLRFGITRARLGTTFFL